MNAKNLLLCSLLFSLCACEKESHLPAEGERATIEWIENTLRKNYLWNSEIPASKLLDYALAPAEFFPSLLSRKDGKDYTDVNGVRRHTYYSYIEELGQPDTRGYINDQASYGFEYQSLVVYNKDTRKYDYYVFVEYVLEGSPAYEAGLERGDWIVQIEGQAINDLLLIGEGAAHTFTVVRHDGNQFGNPRKVSIAAARPVNDHPVHLWSILHSNRGKRVAYLVYNQFETGVEGVEGDTSYNDRLIELSNQFSGQVDEFVLDLRYNNGGELTCAVLLCTMLCPANAMGQELGYLKYNNGRTEHFRADDAVVRSIRNLGLKRLYVLTSEQSASASEMVINSLRPYMEVVVVGWQTAGKNVGSVEYTDAAKQWRMHPIVCSIYNSQGFGDYADGLAPDVRLHEVFGYDADGYVDRIYPTYPLGNPNERLLQAALAQIDQTSTRSAEGGALSVRAQEGAASIARKATPGVLLR
ncbi:MAG: PDZ domain-containing protein [Prevotellaceae bacterium]|jgi:C-terminal processing protease CtpA/Prc|nr:PDZ domain-containing protein [Prevotellaceae bacterium]